MRTALRVIAISCERPRLSFLVNFVNKIKNNMVYGLETLCGLTHAHTVFL